MDKRISLALLISVSILSLSLISALYSGESTVINSGLDNFTSYNISDNTSNIILTNLDNISINISIPSDADSQTFTITFNGYSQGQEKITTYSSGGDCSTAWSCSDWSNCINNKQNRTCKKVKQFCLAPKINLTQSCTPPILNKENVNNITIDLNKTVNNIKEASKSYVGVIILSIIAIVLIILFIWFLMSRHRMKGGEENGTNTDPTD